jgi:hypothetical protein
LFEAAHQRRLRPTGKTDMPNTIRTTPITTRTRLALLALGAISLSSLTLPAMAGDDAPDGGATNPSTCRDLVNHSCLTKPRDDQSSNNQDTKNSNYSRELSIILKHDDQEAADSVEIERQWSAWRAAQTERDWQNVLRLPTIAGRGGNGGAAGRTGSRIAAPLPPDARTNASAAPPKAAVPKSTTVDKVANTITRDYRTGATTAPGGPPPAAAIGTKPTAPQVAAQTPVVRDHRH